jgi:ribosomal-protein-alanine N-acetyltransferase
MNQPTLPFTIQPMTPADIPAVVAVEHSSYSMTWPARAYDYELRKNELAHYFVLRTWLTAPPALSLNITRSETKNLQQGYWAGPQHEAPAGYGQKPVPQPSTIIGIAGFWLMADEMHINTIAVYPDWRGLGLGEWLLLSLIEAGQELGAEVATLEVRPSNECALGLYQKYKFEQVGRRRRYYTDNNEDALIFTTFPLNTPGYQAMLAQRREALFQQLAKFELDKTR